MKITEERMGQLLPQNITDSEELSLATKKVLAAMLDWYLNSKAKETHVVAISNKLLKSISGVGSDTLQETLRELNDFGLVSRKTGTARKATEERGTASEYTIHFKNLKKPLKRMAFDELFSEELKSQENPIRTPLHNSTLHNSTLHNSTLHNSTLHNSKNEEKDLELVTQSTENTNDYFSYFKEKVDEELVGNEDELLTKKIELSTELNSKRMTIGNTICNRCTSYLKRKYEESLALV